MEHEQRSMVERIRRRLRSAPISAYLRGALLRRKFSHAGLLTVFAGRPGVHITNHGGGRIMAENCAFFSGVRLEVFPGATISLGNGTYLNRNTEIISARSVTIGRDCKISWDVVIMDTDQHVLEDGTGEARAITIGDRVWIGCRALILKGVTIGDDAIIGAGAIVTKDVPARGVVTGPAATLRRVLPAPLAEPPAASDAELAALVEARGPALPAQP